MDVLLSEENHGEFCLSSSVVMSSTFYVDSAAVTAADPPSDTESKSADSSAPPATDDSQTDAALTLARDRREGSSSSLSTSTSEIESVSSSAKSSTTETSGVDLVTCNSASSTVVMRRGQGEKANMAAGGRSQSQTTVQFNAGQVAAKQSIERLLDYCEQKITSAITAALKTQADAQTFSFGRPIQRGDDAKFDQLLAAVSSLAQFCLPSYLNMLNQWMRSRQTTYTLGRKTKREDVFQAQRLYCHEGTSTKTQVENMLNEYAFSMFRPSFWTTSMLRYSSLYNLQSAVRDAYADVIGVCAQSRPVLVRRQFLVELRKVQTLRGGSLKEGAAVGAASIPAAAASYHGLSLLSPIAMLVVSLKKFRVRMHTIDELEASMEFLNELGKIFRENKDKDVRNELARVFVEILTPVAAAVHNEVNVPSVKAFVDSLYSFTLDLVSRNKNRSQFYPMVTCLLCISSKQFFRGQWLNFLVLCLQQLKSRDSRIAKTALDCLYRLIWVYMIRVKCESNSATESRLKTIIDSLFPRGTKGVVPKDASLQIFVKILHFIAQGRLDIAMRNITTELLGANRPLKSLAPERMSIGIRTFLVITHSLQARDPDISMPATPSVLPVGNTLTLRSKQATRYLTDESAKTLGIAPYYGALRSSFDGILKLVDKEVGRCLLVTKVENYPSKENEDLLSGERKPRLDLLRTCLMAIPRLMPDGLAEPELIQLTSRLTLHLDLNVRQAAQQTLSNMMWDLPALRDELLIGFVQLCQREITEAFPAELDNALRILLQLLQKWTSSLTSGSRSKRPNAAGSTENRSRMPPLASAVKKRRRWSNEMAAHLMALQHTEGFALIMLANCKLSVRRMALVILTEIRLLYELLVGEEHAAEKALVSVLNGLCPEVARRILLCDMSADRLANLDTSGVDLHVLLERSASSSTSSLPAAHVTTGPPAGAQTGAQSSVNAAIVDFHADHTTPIRGLDRWMLCLIDFMHTNSTFDRCSSPIGYAWQILYPRLNFVYNFIDPSNPMNEPKSGIFGGGVPKRSAEERDVYLCQWQRYAALAMCVASPSKSVTALLQQQPIQRSLSPIDASSAGASPTGWTGESLDTRITAQARSASAKDVLSRMVLPLLRAEGRTEKDTAADVASDVTGHCAVRNLADVYEELLPLLREALDRTKETNRRKARKRDALRKALSSVFRRMAFNGLFGQLVIALRQHRQDKRLQRQDGRVNRPGGGADHELRALIDALFGELEQTVTLLRTAQTEIEMEVKLNFAQMLYHLVYSVPEPTRYRLFSGRFGSLRHSLFLLLISWSGRYGVQLSDHVNSMALASATSTLMQHHESTLSLNSQQEIVDTEHTLTELEWWSLQALSGIVVSGQVFDVDWTTVQHQSTVFSAQPFRLSATTADTGVTDEGFLLRWLYALFNAKSAHVLSIAERTLTALLAYNSKETPLCDWVMDCCYRSPNVIVRRSCFLALVQAHCRDACELPVSALLVLALVHLGSDMTAMNAAALRLLEICLGSLGTTFSDTQTPPVPSQGTQGLIEQLQRSERWKQRALATERIATFYPEDTCDVFCEVTYRFQNCIGCFRDSLAEILEPWLHNVELVGDLLPVPLSLGAACSEQPSSSVLYHLPVPSRAAGHSGKLGFGSPEVTPLILNNVFYLTYHCANDHGAALQRIWTSLVEPFPGNLRYVYEYTYLMCCVSSDLLPCCKLVMSYLRRASPDHLLQVVLAELQMFESGGLTLARTSTLPFYRLTVHAGVSNSNSNSSDGKARSPPPSPAAGSSAVVSDSPANDNAEEALAEQQETTSEDDGKGRDGGTTAAVAENGSRPPLVRHLRQPALGGFECPVYELIELVSSERGQRYWRPPDAVVVGSWLAPTAGEAPRSLALSRHSFALLVLGQALSCNALLFDWTEHLPLILHLVSIALDHHRPVVVSHCKQLLRSIVFQLSLGSGRLKLAHLAAGSFDDPSIGGIKSHDSPFPMAAPSYLDRPSLGLNAERVVAMAVSAGGPSTNAGRSGSASVMSAPASSGTGQADSIQLDRSKLHHQSAFSLLSVDTITPDLIAQSAETKLVEAAAEFLAVLASKLGRPLWHYDDAASMVGPSKGGSLGSTASFVELSRFVSNAVPLFTQLICVAPTTSDGASCLELAWCRIALTTGTRSSVRHVAERSLQLVRALKVPLDAVMLSEVVERLAETVGDSSDETQRYVIELLETIADNVTNCDEGTPRNLGVVADRASMCLSSSVLRAEFVPSTRIPSGGLSLVEGGRPARKSRGTQHRRSCSESSNATRSTNFSIRDEQAQEDTAADVELRPCDDGDELEDEDEAPTPLPTVDSNSAVAAWAEAHPMRSCSEQTLLAAATEAASDPTMSSVLPRAEPAKTTTATADATNVSFWVAVALLQSDYEHEFRYGLSLLDKTLQRLDLSCSDVVNSLEALGTSLGWFGPDFPGIIFLLLKAVSHESFVDEAWAFVSQLSPHCGLELVFATSSVRNVLLQQADDRNGDGCSLAVVVYTTILMPFLIAGGSGDVNSERRCCAGRLSKLCGDSTSAPLQQLAAVMRLYSNGELNKDHSWHKSVLKCALESFDSADEHNGRAHGVLLNLLLDMFDQVAESYQTATLTAIGSLVAYIDLSHAAVLPSCSRLMTTLQSLLMQTTGQNSERVKLAQSILTCTVSRSASLPGFNQSATTLSFSSTTSAVSTLRSTAGSDESSVEGTGSQEPTLASRRVTMPPNICSLQSVFTPPTESVPAATSGVAGGASTSGVGSAGGVTLSSLAAALPGVASPVPLSVKPDLPGLTLVLDDAGAGVSGAADAGAGAGAGTGPVGKGSDQSQMDSELEEFNIEWMAKANWGKSQQSRTVVKQRLAALAECFGQRVDMGRSPSMIFSEMTLEGPHSVISSDETSLPDSVSMTTLSADRMDLISVNTDMSALHSFDFLEEEFDIQSIDMNPFEPCPTLLHYPPNTSSGASSSGATDVFMEESLYSGVSSNAGADLEDVEMSDSQPLGTCSSLDSPIITIIEQDDSNTPSEEVTSKQHSERSSSSEPSDDTTEEMGSFASNSPGGRNSSCRPPVVDEDRLILDDLTNGNYQFGESETDLVDSDGQHTVEEEDDIEDEEDDVDTDADADADADDEAGTPPAYSEDDEMFPIDEDSQPAAVERRSVECRRRSSGALTPSSDSSFKGQQMEDEEKRDISSSSAPN